MNMALDLEYSVRFARNQGLCAGSGGRGTLLVALAESGTEPNTGQVSPDGEPAWVRTKRWSDAGFSLNRFSGVLLRAMYP